MTLLADRSVDAGSNVVRGAAAQTKTFTMPGNVVLGVESVAATIANGSTAAVTPTLIIREADGTVIAEVPADASIPAGDSGVATWALRLGGSSAAVTPATPGFTLDYAEAPTGNFSVTATSEATAQVWIQGNSVTYDGATTIKITVWAALATSNRDVVLELFMDGVDQGRIGQWSPTALSASSSIIGIGHVVPSAGAHTFQIRAWQTLGGTSTLTNPAPFPAVAFQPSFYEIVASSPLV